MTTDERRELDRVVDLAARSPGVLFAFGVDNLDLVEPVAQALKDIVAAAGLDVQIIPQGTALPPPDETAIAVVVIPGRFGLGR